MKFLFSLIAVALIVGIDGQKHRAKGGKKGGHGTSSGEASAEAAPEPAEVAQPNVTSANFNETDKTQFSRRQWMEIAINQFFDDFENGITSNAPYIFAPGAPYISNGAIYVGLDMADYRTWDVIPRKTRIDRDFSVFNRTETWVRCMGVYPDGHQALEFTSFTFDNKGMITSMSKLENKECPTPAVAAGPVPTAAANTTTAATTTVTPVAAANTTVMTPPKVRSAWWRYWNFPPDLSSSEESSSNDGSSSSDGSSSESKEESSSEHSGESSSEHSSEDSSSSEEGSEHSGSSEHSSEHSGSSEHSSSEHSGSSEHSSHSDGSERP